MTKLCARTTKILGVAIAVTFFATGAFAQDDPPSRIARLNYISGSVSMQPAGADDWGAAEPNRPFTTGDALYTDINSRAEFHMDMGVIRLGQQTSFSFLTLNDETAQLSVTEGDLYINLRELGPNQTFEVDTPNAAVSLLRTGIYRFRVTANGSTSYVVTRQGQAEITGGGQAFNLTPGDGALLSGVDQLTYDVEQAPAPDDFDQWSAGRDAREANLASARYLPRSVIGYEDLDDYGGWQSEANYGPVWYPRTVVAGWAPYHYGHWAWVEPWGWTWVDQLPWGFAPFHYGRWAFISGRWGWCPGPIVIVANRPPVMRPVYAPALVAWFGGAHWGVSVQVGGAPNLGWVALGIGDVYTPSYHCSPHYFNNVNVSNTTIVKTVNITNVYNTVYVNKTVYNQKFVNVQAPNAVSAMPQNAFASGRSVQQASVVVRAEDVRTAQISGAAVVAPPVAPTRQSLVTSNVQRPVVRPPAQISARQVVVRTTPAPVPAPFAARQAYLQQHVGQPHDFATMHRAVLAQSPQAAAARPVAVRSLSTLAPAKSVATPVPAARPAPLARPNQPAAAQQTPVPAQRNEAQPARVAERPVPQAQSGVRPAETKVNAAPAVAPRSAPAAEATPRPVPAAVAPARPTPAAVATPHPAPAVVEPARPALARPSPATPAAAAEPRPAPAAHSTPVVKPAGGYPVRDFEQAKTPPKPQPKPAAKPAPKEPEHKEPEHKEKDKEKEK